MQVLEQAWTQGNPALESCLTPYSAGEILARHSQAYAQIRAEADLALAGWAEVPGFGRRPIKLIPELC